MSGLHWKLTITYTLVTGAFLLGVELVFLGLANQLPIMIGQLAIVVGSAGKIR